MLNDATCFKQIYIVTGYTDLRFGLDSLASIIESKSGRSPYVPDTLYLFCGRKTDRIKGLVWEKDGFLLLYKRLEKGSFVWPRNEDAARLSGVSTAKVKLFVYVFCGILSGIAGILICSRITSGNGTVAEGYEMNAISAAVIGGVSMTGGSGNVLGMVVGAMILTIIQNSFDIMGVNSFYQNIIKGIIILLAVFLDLRGKKKKN